MLFCHSDFSVLRQSVGHSHFAEKSDSNFAAFDRAEKSVGTANVGSSQSAALSDRFEMAVTFVGSAAFDGLVLFQKLSRRRRKTQDGLRMASGRPKAGRSNRGCRSVLAGEMRLKMGFLGPGRAVRKLRLLLSIGFRFEYKKASNDYLLTVGKAKSSPESPLEASKGWVDSTHRVLDAARQAWSSLSGRLR